MIMTTPRSKSMDSMRMDFILLVTKVADGMAVILLKGYQQNSAKSTTLGNAIPLILTRSI